MASTTRRRLGATVELDGAKEYKEAIAELNVGNATLRSEMQKLQAEYKGQADSTEFLTKKGELLERQLLQQQDKVKKLQEAVAWAAKEYGEADGRTQDWIQQLNRAQAAEFNLKHDIEENNEALNGQNEEMTGLGDTVDGFASKLGIKIPDGAKKALNGMQGLSSGTVAAMATAAAAITAVIKVVSELHEMTLEAAADADQLLSDSLTTGLSTQTLQELQYAEGLIDVSVNTITGSLTKLTNNMASANDGNEAMAESFANLGVSITDSVDGSLRPAEEVFYELIDALGTIPNETKRDAVAMELFGKSAQELNPLIAEGSDALKAYAEEAQNLGYVMSEDELEALGAVDDAFQKMNLTIDTVKNQIAVDFAPASESAMELFADVVKSAGEMLEKSGIIENLASIITSLIDIIRTAGDILSSIPGFNTALDSVKIALQSVAVVCATIADVADIIAGLFSLDFNRIETALGWNRSSGELSNTQRALGYGDTTGQWYNESTGMWEGNLGHNAGGTSNWRGGLTWVGESGAELVNLPRGTQILSAQESMNAGDVYIGTVVIDAKSVNELNDIVRIFNGAQVKARMR